MLTYSPIRRYLSFIMIGVAFAPSASIAQQPSAKQLSSSFMVYHSLSTNDPVQLFVDVQKLIEGGDGTTITVPGEHPEFADAFLSDMNKGIDSREAFIVKRVALSTLTTIFGNIPKNKYSRLKDVEPKLRALLTETDQHLRTWSMVNLEHGELNENSKSRACNP